MGIGSWAWWPDYNDPWNQMLPNFAKVSTGGGGSNGGYYVNDRFEAIMAEAAHFTDPTWEMRNPSVHAFGLENGEQQMRVAFDRVEIARPEGVAPVVLTDATVAADYVASVEDHYAHEVSCPWASIVEAVRTSVQQVIDTEGSFIDHSEVGAFICS